MKILIIVFIVISVLLSLSSMSYVTADIILEQKNKKLEDERRKAEARKNGKKQKPSRSKTETVAEPEALPEPVEHIDAVHADEMISNALAMRMVSRERGAGHGKQEVVNIGDIDQAFEAGAVVTVAELKAKRLVSQSAGRVKILAGGILNKPLTVKAESMSIQAIKMIELTGGTVVIMKND